jgi:hypothetical protein
MLSYTATTELVQRAADLQLAVYGMGPMSNAMRHNEQDSDGHVRAETSRKYQEIIECRRCVTEMKRELMRIHGIGPRRWPSHAGAAPRGMLAIGILEVFDRSTVRTVMGGTFAIMEKRARDGHSILSQEQIARAIEMARRVSGRVS